MRYFSATQKSNGEVVWARSKDNLTSADDLGPSVLCAADELLVQGEGRRGVTSLTAPPPGRASAAAPTPAQRSGGAGSRKGSPRARPQREEPVQRPSARAPCPGGRPRGRRPSGGSSTGSLCFLSPSFWGLRHDTLGSLTPASASLWAGH